MTYAIPSGNTNRFLSTRMSTPSKPIIRLTAEESWRLIEALKAPARPPGTSSRKALQRYRQTVQVDVNRPINRNRATVSCTIEAAS